jgi:hypothetical protein
MKKLSLDTLKERSEAIETVELLSSINGGTHDSCHCDGMTTPSNLYDLLSNKK